VRRTTETAYTEEDTEKSKSYTEEDTEKSKSDTEEDTGKSESKSDTEEEVKVEFCAAENSHWCNHIVTHASQLWTCSLLVM